MHLLHQVRIWIILLLIAVETWTILISCIIILDTFYSTIAIRNDLYQFDTGVTRRRFLDVLDNDTAAPGRTLSVDSARVLPSTRRNLQDLGYTCDVSGNRQRVRFRAIEDFEGTARCEYTACDGCKCGTALIVIRVGPESTWVEIFRQRFLICSVLLHLTCSLTSFLFTFLSTNVCFAEQQLLLQQPRAQLVLRPLQLKVLQLPRAVQLGYVSFFNWHIFFSSYYQSHTCLSTLYLAIYSRQPQQQHQRRQQLAAQTRVALIAKRVTLTTICAQVTSHTAAWEIMGWGMTPSLYVPPLFNAANLELLLLIPARTQNLTQGLLAMVPPLYAAKK